MYSFQKTLIQHTAAEGTVFDFDVLENEYHLFDEPLTSLTLTRDEKSIQESVYDFTAADPFVFDFVDLENLYGNEIKKGDRIIISIRMGVMEIRKVITGGGGDRSYTLDFQMSAELVQDLNILGPIKIAKIKAKNCAKSIFILYRRDQAANTPDTELELLIPDGELLMWEIRNGQPTTN